MRKDTSSSQPRRVLSCLTLLAVPWFASCENPNGPDITIINTSTSSGSGPGTTPGSSPSPGDGGSLPQGTTIRVGLVGSTCPAGVRVPPNSSREIPLGCAAFVTCTPKDAQGNDIDSVIHGPTATWAVPFGSERVSISRPSNPFNLDVRGVSLGQFRLECTVKNLTGGADFTITSASATSLGRGLEILAGS